MYDLLLYSHKRTFQFCIKSLLALCFLYTSVLTTCVIFLHGKKAVSDLESQLYDRSRCIVNNAYIAIFKDCIMGNYIAKFPTSLLFPRHYWVDAPPLLLLYSCVKVIKLIYAKAIISYHNMRWWRLNFLYNTNFPHKRETIVMLQRMPSQYQSISNSSTDIEKSVVQNWLNETLHMDG